MATDVLTSLSDEQLCADAQRGRHLPLDVIESTKLLADYQNRLGFALACVDAHSGTVLTQIPADSLFVLPQIALTELSQLPGPWISESPTGLIHFALPFPSLEGRPTVAMGFALAATHRRPPELILAAAGLNWTQGQVEHYFASLPTCTPRILKKLLDAAWSEISRATLECGTPSNIRDGSRGEIHAQHDELLLSFVRSLVSSLDAKDPYTRGHSERVALIARRLGEELKLSDDELHNIYLSGLLHDIGKIGVDDKILRKPGQLTEDEFRQVQKHPIIGYNILAGLKNLNAVIPGVRHHHEAYSGKGYPDGLAGEQIPLMARIIAVADSYDAMGSDRPYRTGMPLEILDGILTRGAGVQWDPRVVAAYQATRDDIRGICETYCPNSGNLVNAMLIDGELRDAKSPAGIAESYAENHAAGTAVHKHDLTTPVDQVIA